MKPYNLYSKIALVFATVCIFGAFESARAQSNFVINGTFDKDTSGWTMSNPYARWQDKGNPNGCFFILTYPPTNVQTVSQRITGMTPGGSYLLTADYAFSDDYILNIDAPSFEVTMGGATVFQSKEWNVSEPGWRTFSIPFTATSSAEDLSFSAQLNNTQVSYLIDNIAIQAVPEPNSLYLIGMGGIAGLFLLRRKASKARC